MQHLRDVFTQLRSAGLTLKPSKCQLAMRQCYYLGHIVGNGTIQPETSKMMAVEEFPVPQTKSQALGFPWTGRLL